MARITPKDPSTKLVRDGEPITFTPHYFTDPEPPQVMNVTGISPEADGQFVRVPAGMTADEVRHRLETWEPMRAALESTTSALSVAVELVNNDTIRVRPSERDALMKWLEAAHAALAAAENGTPNRVERVMPPAPGVDEIQ